MMEVVVHDLLGGAHPLPGAFTIMTQCAIHPWHSSSFFLKWAKKQVDTVIVPCCGFLAWDEYGYIRRLNSPSTIFSPVKLHLNL